MKLLLTAFVSALLSCATAVAQVPGGKMKIATGVDPSFSVFYVGKLGGYFEANGLDVELSTGPSGSAMVPLLIKNQLQSALAAEQAGIQTFALDKDVVVAAETGETKDDLFGLVGRSDIDLGSLKGKKVGVTAGTASEVFWRALVTKTGLDTSGIQIVNIEQPEMPAALARKDVDAVSTYEPWVTRMMQSLPGMKVIRTNKGIHNSHLYLYVNRSWASANRQQATAFMKALMQANEQIVADPEKSAQQVASFLKLDPGVTRLIMKKLIFQIRLDQGSVDYLKTVDQQLRDAGKLKTPTDWNRFIYDDLIKSVRN